MGLVHELLFADHHFFLGKLFFLNNSVFALTTHQLTIIKDLKINRMNIDLFMCLTSGLFCQTVIVVIDRL